MPTLLPATVRSSRLRPSSNCTRRQVPKASPPQGSTLGAALGSNGGHSSVGSGHVQLSTSSSHLMTPVLLPGQSQAANSRHLGSSIIEVLPSPPADDEQASATKPSTPTATFFMPRCPSYHTRPSSLSSKRSPRSAAASSRSAATKLTRPASAGRVGTTSTDFGTADHDWHRKTVVNKIGEAERQWRLGLYRSPCLSSHTMAMKPTPRVGTTSTDFSSSRS